MVFAIGGDSRAVWAVFFLWNIEPGRPPHWLGLFAVATVALYGAESAISTSRLFLISRHSDRLILNTDWRRGNDALSWLPLFGLAWVVETATAISGSVSRILVDVKRHA